MLVYMSTINVCDSRENGSPLCDCYHNTKIITLHADKCLANSQLHSAHLSTMGTISFTMILDNSHSLGHFHCNHFPAQKLPHPMSQIHPSGYKCLELRTRTCSIAIPGFNKYVPPAEIMSEFLIQPCIKIHFLYITNSGICTFCL